MGGPSRRLLSAPGDVLHYVYDFGDDWRLALKVESVRPARTEDPVVVATGGRRAAPPEDSGGWGEEEWLAHDGDPAFFDLEGLNRRLGDAFGRR